MSDDFFEVTIAGEFADVREAIKNTPALDFGCRPRLNPLGNERYGIRVFVPSTQLAPLVDRSATGRLTVEVGRNASADGANGSAKCFMHFPPV